MQMRPAKRPNQLRPKRRRAKSANRTRMLQTSEGLQMHPTKLFLRILFVPLALAPALVLAEPSPQPPSRPQPSPRTVSPEPTHAPEASPGVKLCSSFSSDTGALSSDLS